MKLRGWMAGIWNCHSPGVLGTSPQKQLQIPSLENLKCSAGCCAEDCHLRVIYGKSVKLFDMSAFLLVQIINKKTDFWTEFLFPSQKKEMISLKVSCSLFRYFSAICHIPKEPMLNRIGMASLNLLSTKYVAWDWLMKCEQHVYVTPQTHRK